MDQAANRTILCVLSPEQRAEYQPEFDQLRHAGVELGFRESAEQALDEIGELQPAVVLVGMEVGAMEGLEFVALLMNRYRDYSGKVLVLPGKDDPFPPVLQQRNPATGKSTTEQIDLADIATVMLQAAAAGAPAGGEPPAAAAGVASPPLDALAQVSSDATPPLDPPATAIDQALAHAPTPPPAPDADQSAQSVPAPAPAPPNPVSLPRDNPPTRGSRPAWLWPVVGLAAAGVVVAVILASRGGSSSKPATSNPPADPGPTTTQPATGPVAPIDASTAVAVTDPDDPATDPIAPLRTLTTLPLAFTRGGTRFTITDPAELDQLVTRFAQALEQAPPLWLEVGGHTSIEGAPEANHELGRQRGDQVRNLLTERGVPRSRIVVKNYGPSSPASDDQSGKGRGENRRVTLRLID